MGSNAELLACPGYTCDTCKVRSTCRRVRAEEAIRRRRERYWSAERTELRTRLVNELGLALDEAVR